MRDYPRTKRRGAGLTSPAPLLLLVSKVKMAASFGAAAGWLVFSGFSWPTVGGKPPDRGAVGEVLFDHLRYVLVP